LDVYDGHAVCRFINYSFSSQLQVHPVISASPSSGFVAIQTAASKYWANGFSAVGQIASFVEDGRVAIKTIATTDVVSQPFQTRAHVVDDVIGRLHAKTVYHDRGLIEFTLLLRNKAHFSVEIIPPEIIGIVTKVGGSTAAAVTTTKRCNRKPPNLCKVAIKLPPAFVDALTSGDQLRVSAKTKGGGATVELGILTFVRGHSGLADPQERLYATLPSHGLFADQEFDVPVRANFRMPLKTAEVRLRLGEGLSFVGDAIAKNAGGDQVFFGTIDRASSIASVSLVRKGLTSVSVSGDLTDELLFTLRVRVSKHGVTRGNSTVQLEGLRFKDGNEALVKAGQSSLLGRDGESSGTAALVYFEHDAVVGVLGYAHGSTELLNTAVISGRKVLRSVVVKAVTSRGVVRDISSGSTCTSDTPEVAKVQQRRSNCHVVLDGTEAHGAHRVAITVNYGGFADVLSFRIHYPVSVALRSSRSILRPIAGYFDRTLPGCAHLRYQETPLTAVANFSADGVSTNFVDYDVTMIASIISTESETARVSQNRYGQPVVTGLSPGQAGVAIHRPD